jgi:hypothetical protein
MQYIGYIMVIVISHVHGVKEVDRSDNRQIYLLVIPLMFLGHCPTLYISHA